MGLLGDIFSTIDTKKRQLKGLLADPGGTVDMGVARLREDQQNLQNLFANAYPMAGDKTVLNSPQQIARFQREAADKAGEIGTLGGMLLYHGSNASTPIKKITSDGPFGGLFASPAQRSAASHGDAVYRMTVPDSQIMNVGDDLPWENVQKVVGSNIRKDSPYADDISDMVLNAKSAFDSSIPEDDLIHALRASDLGEADWELQRLRGLLGKSEGYKAVQMPDEHGMSYLVLPGTTARPANTEARNLFRKNK